MFGKNKKLTIEPARYYMKLTIFCTGTPIFMADILAAEFLCMYLQIQDWLYVLLF